MNVKNLVIKNLYDQDQWFDIGVLQQQITLNGIEKVNLHPGYLFPSTKQQDRDNVSTLTFPDVQEFEFNEYIDSNDLPKLKKFIDKIQ